MDNEINLNADKSCTKTCSDYKNTKNYGCAEDTLCAESHIDEASLRCKGTVYDCDYVDDDLAVCPVTITVLSLSCTLAHTHTQEYEHGSQIILIYIFFFGCFNFSRYKSLIHDAMITFGTRMEKRLENTTAAYKH